MITRSYSISQRLWSREASLYTKAGYFGSGAVASSAAKGSGMVVHLFGGYTTVSCGSSKNTKKTPSKPRPLGSGDVSGLVGTATVSNQHTVYMIQPSNASTTTTTTATATVPLTRNSASRAPRGRASATNKQTAVNSQAKSIAPRKLRAPSPASLSSSAVSSSASKAPRLLPGVEALGHGCVLCLLECRVFSCFLDMGLFCTSAGVVSFSCFLSLTSTGICHPVKLEFSCSQSCRQCCINREAACSRYSFSPPVY
jgi:hypothetical protein